MRTNPEHQYLSTSCGVSSPGLFERWLKFLILCILGSSAFAEETPRIAGGRNANIKDFPYQVSMQTVVSGRLRHFCGGSILSAEWILTAAHCIEGLTQEQRSNLVVVVGSTKLSEAAQNGQTIASAGEFYVHPSYEGEVKPDDVAIFKIGPGLQFNENVSAVKLPESGADVTGRVSLSGWGSTRYVLNVFFPNTPDTLQRATYEIMSIRDCRRAYGLQGASVDEQANICTKTAGFIALPSSACGGDSGGPLTQDGVQVGIVSWGGRICGLYPSVYTKVSHYVDFIRQHVPDV